MKLLKDLAPELRDSYSELNEEPFDALTASAKIHYSWNCSTCGGLKSSTVAAFRSSSLCIGCARAASARGRSLASIKRFGSIESLPDELKVLYRGGVPASSVAANSKKPVAWSCSHCPVTFSASPYDLRGPRPRRPLCSTCSAKVGGVLLRSATAAKGSLTLHPDVAKEWDPALNSLTPEEIPQFSALQIAWLCSVCGLSYRAAVYNRTYGGTGCPSCGLKSRFERLVRDELERRALRFESNRFLLRDSTGRRLQLDFWIPELRLALEVQDLATHSRESDHCEANFRGGALIKKGPAYHELKRRLARDQLGATLVDIWEDELLELGAATLIESAILVAPRR